MTQSQKEWIPLYGMFVIPEWEDISIGRGVFMGLYHGWWTVMAVGSVLLVYSAI